MIADFVAFIFAYSIYFKGFIKISSLLGFEIEIIWIRLILWNDQYQFWYMIL